MYVVFSPVRAPSHIARGQVFVTSRLLDKDVDLLLKVLLVRYRTFLLTQLDSSCRCQSLINLLSLVWVVELKATQLVLNPLDYDLSNLVQLVLPGVLVLLLLHELAYLVVLHVARELALSHVAPGLALVVPLETLKDIVDDLASDVCLLAFLKLSHDIELAFRFFNVGNGYLAFFTCQGISCLGPFSCCGR